MSQEEKRVTIRDVARHARVSFKTVSRVINGVPTVDPDMRARVERAVEELGYRPHRAAKLLGGGKSSTLALLFGSEMSAKDGAHERMPSFAVDILTGALRACREANYNLMVLEFDGDETESCNDLDRALQDLPIDGAILMPPWCDYPWLLDYLEARKVPFARILPGSELDRGVTVVVDNYPAGQAVAELLLELGHRKVGMISAPEGHLAGNLRIEAFVERMQQESDVTLTKRPGDFFFEGGHIQGGQLLDMKERPTAIFAANDEMAAGVLAAAIDRGIAVPRELSIMGYGDLWISKQTWPRLSTVHQPIVEMAEAGASALIDAPDKKSVASLQMYRPFSIVKRGSLAKVTSA